jgi:hypothetical protein
MNPPKITIIESPHEAYQEFRKNALEDRIVDLFMANDYLLLSGGFTEELAKLKSEYSIGICLNPNCDYHDNQTIPCQLVTGHNVCFMCYIAVLTSASSQNAPMKLTKRMTELKKALDESTSKPKRKAENRD